MNEFTRPRDPLPAWLWRLAAWGTAACLLLLPLIAMQFTEEVNWTGSDFAVFGTMLLIACGTCELALRLSRNLAFRAAVAVAVLAGFALVWINLAVGIIASEANPANLMFAGVLMVGLLGALFARFRPAGMVLALLATAAAQIAVGVIALLLGYDDTALIVGGVFAALWLLSAWLFQIAARQSQAA